jgi:hypothetical protein
VVPGHDVAWVIAVPRQHAAFEHFDQTGAALHSALCKKIEQYCARLLSLLVAFAVLRVSDEGF